jgi:hypothetical protein
MNMPRISFFNVSVILIRFQPKLEGFQIFAVNISSNKMYGNPLIIFRVTGSVHTEILIEYLFGRDTEAPKKAYEDQCALTET